MGLVDEENDRRGRGFHFFDQTLEPILELALDAGAGLQQCQVECPHMHVLQRRGHIALGNTQGKAFDHGGLADAGFTRKDGIVLPAASEDVDHLANLRIAAQHRVDLALAWHCR